MSENKRSEKASLRERLCHTLDIQPDIFPGGTLVEIRGRNSVTVKGGGRITVYTDSEVRLLTRNGSVCIRGSRLCCSAYCKGATSVDGCICSVSFEEAEE
ncbi:MAG: YabP/YqfC family sporulation protein [Clostridia bacterium]|nr:YabP/YqfC family sporulation protein [Clostridia bacterium]